MLVSSAASDLLCSSLSSEVGASVEELADADDVLGMEVSSLVENMERRSWMGTLNLMTWEFPRAKSPGILILKYD
jgi:hypothetical protein